MLWLVHSQTRAPSPFDLSIQMVHVPATPDELLHIVEGRAHGFESLSLVYSETKPGGGAAPIGTRPEKPTSCWRARCGIRSETARSLPRLLSSFGTRPAWYILSCNVSDRPIHVIGALPRSYQQEIDAD